MFVQQNCHSPSRMDRTTNYGHVSYISITSEINQYIVEKCMYTIQICFIYSIYSTNILYTSVHQRLQSYTTQVEAVNPLTPENTVLKGIFVLNLQNFDLHNVFQEHNPSLKQDLPVVLTKCICLNHLEKPHTSPLHRKNLKFRS